METFLFPPILAVFVPNGQFETVDILIHFLLGLLLGSVFLVAIFTHNFYEKTKQWNGMKHNYVAGAMNVVAVILAFIVLIFVMRFVGGFEPIDWPKLVVFVMSWLGTIILGIKRIRKYNKLDL
jgi:hypothetical protein